MRQPNSAMRFNSASRAIVFSQLAMASAVSSPIPRTWSSCDFDARRMAGASPKCSSNCRARTGPTCSIRFSATRASRASIPESVTNLLGRRNSGLAPPTASADTFWSAIQLQARSVAFMREAPLVVEHRPPLGLAQYPGHLCLVFLAPCELVIVEAGAECFQEFLAAGAGAGGCLIQQFVPLVAPLGPFRRRTVLQFVPRRQNGLDALLTRHQTPHRAPVCGAPRSFPQTKPAG